jgi:hypothetical protein
MTRDALPGSGLPCTDPSCTAAVSYFPGNRLAGGVLSRMGLIRQLVTRQICRIVSISPPTMVTGHRAAAGQAGPTQLPTVLRLPGWAWRGCRPLAVLGRSMSAGIRGRRTAGAGGVLPPAPLCAGVNQPVTTMPAGVAPAGSEVGDPASSVRFPPSTAKAPTAPILLSSTYR